MRHRHIRAGLLGALSPLLIGGLTLAEAPYATQAATASTAGFGAATVYPQGSSIASGALAAMPASGQMKVFLYVDNLQPMQVYKEYMDSGTCSSRGNVVYSLPPAQADADGSIQVDTMINAARIPTQGLAVTVQLSLPKSPIIACGNVHPVGTVIKLNPLKISLVPNAQGFALITRTMGNQNMTASPMSTGTEVVVYAKNLEPSTVHEEHIHAGACNADMAGQVRYPLSYLETDPTGQGVASTFIPGNPSFYGSELNVHAADLRPATCGNFG